MRRQNMRHKPVRKSKAGWFVTGVLMIVIASAAYMSMRHAYETGFRDGVEYGVDLAVETFEAAQPIELPEPVTLSYTFNYTEVFIGNGTLASENRNPLNIKARSTDPWEGQIGRDKYGHAVFETWEHGIRAASLVLRSYAVTHEIDTVEGIINRFAEGNREAYVAFLCNRLDVRADEPLDIIARMPDLLRAMSRFESGMELPDKYFIAYDILAKPLTTVKE